MQKSEQRQMQIVTVKSSRHRQSCSSARKRQKQRSSSSSRMQRQRKPWQKAVRFAREQEAEGIRATGLAEAEAIRAKATAEAEGIDKKAEAMKKYGEAAIIEMIMQALPEIAKNVAEPLSKVDKITMYGEGNSAKMLQDIINSTTQVTEGLAQGMGIDVKALLSSIVGAKIASNTPEDPQKSDSDEYEQ